MFIPRLITFLVTIGCAFGAILFAGNTFSLPEWLRVLPTLALSIFTLSGLVMLIGTFGMRMQDGKLEFTKTLLGKMMQFITKGRSYGKELHCCDIYIDSTKTTAAGLAILLILGIAVVFIYVHFLFLIVLAIVVFAIYLGRRQLGRVVNSVSKKINQSSDSMDRKTVRKAEGMFMWMLIALVVCSAVALLAGIGYIAYLAVVTLMALGYTLLQSIGLATIPILVACFPLFCIAGKKLLLHTGLAKQLCPAVRR